VKILIVLHDYLPLHKGGSEIHAHQTARELVSRGHDVTALFTERDLSVAEGTQRRGELEGVPTIEVVHQREYGDLRESWEEERSLAIFRELLAELDPDVVHFHHLAIWGSGALVAAREHGARVVVTLHDYWAICDAATLLRSDGELCTEGTRGDCSDCLARHPLRPELWGRPELRGEAQGPATPELYARAARARFEKHRADLPAAHVVISPSRFLAERFEEAGFLRAEDCVVCKAGYPGPLHPPRTRSVASDERPLRVGYVGGIYFSKGLHVLVEAMASLDDVPVELAVHGHLDWFPDYVASLERAAAGRPVRFHGPFDPGELDRVLATIDVLVVPSVWYENMPITIQEGYRNGIPVVAAGLGGMAEAVVDGAGGLTFPRGDARALAGTLRRLATEPGLYDRIAAARPAVPSLGEVVDVLEGCYRG